MKRACVIGWPVEHSRSPTIHRYWLSLYGIDGAYDEGGRAARGGEGVHALACEHGYVGANVTLPHKLLALEASDVADEAARAIGAANTLWLDGEGKLNASNTDAYGFMTNLVEQAPRWNERRRPVVVLGAGGAARAVLYGLIKAGASKVLLANRSRARADDLACAFPPRVEVVDWDDRDRVLAGCGLLVNTHEPRHDGSGASQDRSWRAAARRGRGRYRL